MPASTVTKNFTDGSVQMKDATGSPISTTAKYSDGDFQVDRLQQKLQEASSYETRGVFNTLRHTNRFYPSGSFTCQMAEFTAATAVSPADAVMKAGAFSAGVSTLGANADVWAITLVFTVEGTSFGDSADHSMTLTNCHCKLAFAEGDPNKFTISWTCYGTVTLA